MGALIQTTTAALIPAVNHKWHKHQRLKRKKEKKERRKSKTCLKTLFEFVVMSACRAGKSALEGSSQ